MPTTKQLEKLVVEDHGPRVLLSKDAGCEVHATRCGAKIRHRHHSPPQSWAIHANKPWEGVIHILCPNAHEGELHVGIDERIKNGKLGRGYGTKVKRMVEETFRFAEEQGLTPSPTL